MATRAQITVYTPERTYRSVYLHWDGYPSAVMPVLKGSYDSFDLANALVDGGFISELADTREDCVYYKETDVEVVETKSFAPLGMDEEFRYLWRDGRWECFEV